MEQERELEVNWAGATEKLELELIQPAIHRAGRSGPSWPGGHRHPQRLVIKQVEVSVKLPPRGGHS